MPEPKTYVFACGCQYTSLTPPCKFRGLVVCPEHKARVLIVIKKCSVCGKEMRLLPMQSKRFKCRECRKKAQNEASLAWSRKTKKGKEPLTGKNIVRQYSTVKSYEPTPEIDPESIPDTKPVTRIECKPAVRPCPWISCQFHMLWAVNQIDQILRYLPDDKIADIALSLSQTCVLDVTDSGEKTLEEIGGILQVSRERIRQIEEGAMAVISQHKRKWELVADFLGDEPHPQT